MLSTGQTLNVNEATYKISEVKEAGFKLRANGYSHSLRLTLPGGKTEYQSYRRDDGSFSNPISI